MASACIRRHFFNGGILDHSGGNTDQRGAMLNQCGGISGQQGGILNQCGGNIDQGGGMLGQGGGNIDQGLFPYKSSIFAVQGWIGTRNSEYVVSASRL